MADTTTYPLRLPHSIKAAAENLARAEGISMNQFIATAVAEKLSALSTADFFVLRAQRAKPDALDKILNRQGGEPPRAGDELP
ncbi:toxin-antitoxin system HicB family antitoxin [Extensimonas sp. H3M7-6]|uniref:toxin-antitoxin system HicB family antitoxin n=1 Tax=Extensimonas soli TaxID=3031322 RepID=UPI0023DA6646|nr:toxin-antitoxin system HicB family antitoxin [Extensimonas sp. H3M7-6]MDF1481502.1 toxin-antitoxin system HicB family antitoxin [Extensimonas sp. H3M7-6]